MSRFPLSAPLAILAAALITSGASAQTAPKPTEAELEAPEYPPPSTRWKVVATGLGTTAAFYGAAVGASFIFPDTPGTHDLRIPLVGPWLAIAHNGCAADEPNCSQAVVVIRSILSALDGVAQAGGLAIALEGLFMPTEVRSFAPPPGPPRTTPPPSPSTAPPTSPAPSPGGSEKNLFFIPTPMNVGERGIGLGVVGRF